MHVCVGCKYVVCKAERDLQAREAAASPKASVKRRAETTYASVVRKYPDSRPGEIAAAELKKLKPTARFCRRRQKPNRIRLQSSGPGRARTVSSQ